MKNSLRVIRFVCAGIGLVALAAVGPAKGGFDLNHYILGCADYCSSVARPLAFSANIDATFTGSWYDPAQSGQGLSLEVLPGNRMLVSWFTFNPDGTQQSWLVGTGAYSGNVATFNSALMPIGGRWIPNFDATRVVDNPWGTMSLTFDDSEHGKVDFSSTLGYGSGSMKLVRLTQPAGITTSALSASGKAWVRTGNLRIPRFYHTATPLADGRVLVAGGLALADTSTAVASAEIFDPATGSWTSTGSMIHPHFSYAAIALADGRILVVDADAELYDPATGRWTSTGSPHTWRAEFTATLLNDGKVLIAGGLGSQDEALASAELYDPESGTWNVSGNLISPRFLHTASALPDGRVLVVGGLDDDFFGTTTDTAELYDPAARVWKSAPPIPGARGLHTATVLENGGVLVAGGYYDGLSLGLGHSVPTSLRDAQIYDASAGTWTTVGSMNAARESHTATRLPDGTVLVAGGVDWAAQGSAHYLANAESFDPKTGAWSGAGGFDVAPVANTATLLQNGNVLLAGGWEEGFANASVSAEVYANVPVSAGSGMTGTWYDPAQSGHGLVVEALSGNRMLATWFAFNPAGTQQSWFLGLGTISGNTATITSVVQPTGGHFIPNFDPTKIVNDAWGTLKVTFTDCNHGKVDFASTVGYGTGSMNLTRLTKPAGLVCP